MSQSNTGWWRGALLPWCKERWRDIRYGLSATVVDRDVQIAWAIGAAVLLVLALTAGQGFVRDEGYYFRAANDYHGWFEILWRDLWNGNLDHAFADATLRRAFGYNTEHPGFVKILMGWSWKLFHGWLGGDHATGYRLGPMLMVAVGCSFLYLLGRRIFDRPTGALGVVLFLACPHVFYHSHLGAFDGPIVAMTVVVCYSFWQAVRTPSTWRLALAGVLFGVAVATKHNAVFLLPTLLLAVWCADAPRFQIRNRRGLQLPPVPLVFFVMVLAAPLVFYLFYPYGWHDPITRIGAYYSYHLHHEHYPVDYFGTLYTKPPFPVHFPFVMSLLTVPLPVLLLGSAGLARALLWASHSLRVAWRGGTVQADATLPAWLLIWNLLVPPSIIAVPTVPIFGGTKHWMPMMPFLALLAAWTLVDAVRFAWRRWPRAWERSGIVLCAALALLIPVAETARSYPLGHTYFNELAGGHQGGAALGMPRTFWGGDGRELLQEINDRASRNAQIFTDRLNMDDFNAYKRDGLLRQDLRYARNLRTAEWALINHQREYWDHELEIWSLTGDKRPLRVLERDGVPLASLYRLK